MSGRESERGREGGRQGVSEREGGGKGREGERGTIEDSGERDNSVDMGV